VRRLPSRRPLPLTPPPPPVALVMGRKCGRPLPALASARLPPPQSPCLPASCPAADIVTLLCLRNAKEGGLSNWSSSVSVSSASARPPAVAGRQQRACAAAPGARLPGRCLRRLTGPAWLVPCRCTTRSCRATRTWRPSWQGPGSLTARTRCRQASALAAGPETTAARLHPSLAAERCAPEGLEDQNTPCTRVV
jgi:hypothetical protein